jgi:hypothetical protein
MQASSRRLVVSMAVLGLVLSGSVLTGASGGYSRTVSGDWVPNGGVLAIARDGDRVYLGGAFTRLINSQTGVAHRRAGVAALDATTGELLPWNPQVTGGLTSTEVRSIGVAPDGTVYVGGGGLDAAGQPDGLLAAVGPGGEPVPGWTATANDMVWDIVATASAVYVGGAFGRVNDVFRPGVARLQAGDGRLDRTFDAHVTDGRVRALSLAPDGETMLLGGNFKTLGGQPRGFVGSVRLDTGTPTDWAPAAVCDECQVLDLSHDEGHAYGAIGGRGGRAIAWSLTSGSPLWMSASDGDVQAIDHHDGVVYAGGHFGPLFAGVERHQLAAIDAGTGVLLSYSLPFVGLDKPGVWAVLADAVGLRIGGYFDLDDHDGDPATTVGRYAAFPSVPDPAPASAPTDVTAAIKDGAATVRWAPPLSDGGAPVEWYDVTAHPADGGAGTRVCATRELTCQVAIGSDGLQEGVRYEFTVRAVNPGGPGAQSERSNPVDSDDLSGPTVTIRQQGWRGVLATPTVSWTATDPSGVETVSVRQRSAAAGQPFGAWTPPQEGVSSIALQLQPGETVCVRVSATDELGNTSDVAPEACRTLALDDRAAVTDGKAKRLTAARYYRGTATQLGGTTSTLRWGGVRAGQARLVATTCPACGWVKVLYGTQRVKTLSLRSAADQHQVVFLLPDASSARRISVRPTSTGKVVVDGLILQAR